MSNEVDTMDPGAMASDAMDPGTAPRSSAFAPPTWPSPVPALVISPLDPPTANESGSSATDPVAPPSTEPTTPSSTFTPIHIDVPATPADPVPDPSPATHAQPSGIQRGPAAILAPDPTMHPLESTGPSLPPTAASPAARPPASAQESPLFVFDATTPTASKRRPARRGRGLRRLIALSMLAGLGYAGVVHGPELYDEYVADQSSKEPAAPLAFPVVRGEPAPVRTATFVVDGLYSDPDASYTVTVDFQTLVSQVRIDRHDEPELEIMTFLDDAVVRRTDSPTWYQIQRGAFPLDNQLELSDWIKRADDVIPREVRPRVSIDEATVADVNGVSTRHLVLTLDPAILDAQNSPMPTLGPLDGISLDEADVDPSLDAVANDATDTAPDDSSDPAPDATTGALAIEPGARPAASGTTVEVELWIDRDGLIRRSRGVSMTGADMVTVLETSGDAWIPDYPAAEQIQPMTAAALIELGL